MKTSLAIRVATLAYQAGIFTEQKKHKVAVLFLAAASIVGFFGCFVRGNSFPYHLTTTIHEPTL